MYYFFEDSVVHFHTTNWMPRSKNPRNLGITLFPFKFWQYIGLSFRNFGYKNARIVLGLGIFQIFFDIPYYK
jgi:hypothetical protein